MTNVIGEGFLELVLNRGMKWKMNINI